MYFVKDGDPKNFQLDIVGFLAILGEASISQTAQISFLALPNFLPRLIPAPQALIPANRPRRLPTYPAVVVGVKSGNRRDHISKIARVLFDVDELPRYGIKCLRITKKDPEKPIAITLRRFGPLSCIALGGFTLSLGLLALTIYHGDGMALLTLLFLGLLSSLAQIGSYYKLELLQWTQTERRTTLPLSNIILYSHKGSFALIQCDEEIARTFFIEPEICQYVVPENIYRLIAFVGTLLLMGGVISLGNASTMLQIAFAVTFLILNAAYWLVAALPSSYIWDTSDIDVREIDPTEAREGIPNAGDAKAKEVKTRATKTKGKDNTGIGFISATNFTQTLWTMIALTGTAEWVPNSGIAPNNKGWRNWLGDAETQATSCSTIGYDKNSRKLTRPNWNCQDALSECLRKASEQDQSKCPTKTVTSS